MQKLRDKSTSNRGEQDLLAPCAKPVTLRAYFFQRIYDQAAFQTRVLDRMTELRRVAFTTVWRTNTSLIDGFAVPGQNLRWVTWRNLAQTLSFAARS